MLPSWPLAGWCPEPAGRGQLAEEGIAIEVRPPGAIG